MTAILTREETAAVRVTRATTVSDEMGHPVARLRFEPAEGVPVVLAYSEATVALFYSGARLHHDLTENELATLVLRGLARLGLDQVRRLDQVGRAAGLAWARGEISDREIDASERRLWPRSEGGMRRHSLAQVLVLFGLGPLR